MKLLVLILLLLAESVRAVPIQYSPLTTNTAVGTPTVGQTPVLSAPGVWGFGAGGGGGGSGGKTIHTQFVNGAVTITDTNITTNCAIIPTRWLYPPGLAFVNENVTNRVNGGFGVFGSATFLSSYPSDNAPVDFTINLTGGGTNGGGGGGMQQTPWLSDINGGFHNLSNVNTNSANQFQQTNLPNALVSTDSKGNFVPTTNINNVVALNGVIVTNGPLVSAATNYDMHDVRWWGARGIPYDDTIPIQTAVNSPLLVGSELRFPFFSLTSSRIILTNNIRLKGCGMQTSGLELYYGFIPQTDCGLDVVMPANASWIGWGIEDFGIIESGSYTGSNALVIDTGSNGCGMQKTTLKHFQTATGGWGIVFTNNHSDGIADSTVQDCLIGGGIYNTAYFGDSMAITRSTIYGTNVGISINQDFAGGAAGLVIEGDVITSSGGFIDLVHASCFSIINNEMELIASHTMGGTRTNLIQILGSAGTVIGGPSKITGNTIVADAGTLATNGIYVDYATNVTIEGNVFSGGFLTNTGHPIYFTVNAQGISLPIGNSSDSWPLVNTQKPLIGLSTTNNSTEITTPGWLNIIDNGEGNAGLSIGVDGAQIGTLTVNGSYDVVLSSTINGANTVVIQNQSGGSSITVAPTGITLVGTLFPAGIQNNGAQTNGGGTLLNGLTNNGNATVTGTVTAGSLVSPALSNNLQQPLMLQSSITGTTVPDFEVTNTVAHKAVGFTTTGYSDSEGIVVQGDSLLGIFLAGSNSSPNYVFSTGMFKPVGAPTLGDAASGLVDYWGNVFTKAVTINGSPGTFTNHAVANGTTNQCFVINTPWYNIATNAMAGGRCSGSCTFLITPSTTVSADVGIVVLMNNGTYYTNDDSIDPIAGLTTPFTHTVNFDMADTNAIIFPTNFSAAGPTVSVTRSHINF